MHHRNIRVAQKIGDVCKRSTIWATRRVRCMLARRSDVVKLRLTNALARMGGQPHRGLTGIDGGISVIDQSLHPKVVIESSHHRIQTCGP